MTTDSKATPAEVNAFVDDVLQNWQAIGIEEHGGILHMPARIRSRKKDGGLVEVPVLLRNVTGPQRLKARTDARAWAKDAGLDLDRDRDLVDLLENYCILGFVVRDPDGHTQHRIDGRSLWKEYDPQSLDQLWAAYEAWTRMLHPSFGKWDGEQLWLVIARIKAGATLTPLAVMPGLEQANCILLMAQEACRSPNAPSFVRSSGTSTRAA